uniref:Uncharacterized protein n=1 Tax=Ciona savignyi TaxID=51511 RepID=H2YXB4_CIOSA
MFCCNNSACFQTVLGRRKRNKKEKTLIIPPQPHGRTSLQTNGSLLPDNRANEFHTIADARPLDDLNTYNQITSDVASEALYASIDNVQPYAVSNVQETYAEIDNPLVFTTSGEARRTDIAS